MAVVVKTAGGYRQSRAAARRIVSCRRPAI